MVKQKIKAVIDKDRNPPTLMNYEEFNRRIEFLRLGIENELLRRKIEELIERMIDIEEQDEYA